MIVTVTCGDSINRPRLFAKGERYKLTLHTGRRFDRVHRNERRRAIECHEPMSQSADDSVNRQSASPKFLFRQIDGKWL